MSVPVKIYRTVTYQEGQTPSNPNLSGDPVVNPINPNGGAAEELVPYDGAIKDVNLGEKGLSTGFVQYDNTPTDTPTGAGTVVWNPDKYTLDLSMGLGDSVQQIGMETYYTPVKNQTGSLIPDGTFVMATGSLGASGRITVAPAVTDGSVDSRYMLGVTTHDIANGGDGLVTWFGEIRGFNTNTKAPIGETWVDGTVLWNNPAVAGGFTSVEPQAPNLKIPVAIVISAGNNGVIFVRPRLGLRLTDLHDVDAFTPSDKDLISYDSALGHWNAKSLGSVIGGTSSQFLKGDGSLDSNAYALASQINIATGQVAFGTVTGTIGGSSDFIWNNSTKRIITNNSAGGGTGLHGTIAGNLEFVLIATQTETRLASYNNKPLYIRTNDIIRATFLGTGELGLGTTSPTNTLDVNGTARIRTLSNATGDFVTASATGVLQKRTASETRTDIGAIGGTIASGQVAFGTAANTIGGDSGLTWDNALKQLNIAPTGGINRSNSLINIAGSISVRDQQTVLVQNSTLSGIDFYTEELSYLSRATNKIARIIPFSDSSVGQAFGLAFYTSGADLDSTEKFRITSGGLVGLNTTSPTNTLDVNGTARIRTLSGTTGYLPLLSSTGVMGQSVVYNTSAGSVLIGTINEVSGHKVRISGGALNITNWQSSAGAYDKLSIDFGENRGFGYDPTPNEIFVKGATTVPVKIDTDAPTDSFNILSTGGIKMANIPSGTIVNAVGLDSNNELVKISSFSSYKLLDEDITPSAFTSGTFATLLTGGILGTNSFDGATDASYEGEIWIRSVDDASSNFDLRLSIWGQNLDVNIVLGSGSQTWNTFVRFRLIIQSGNFLLTGQTVTMLENTNFEYVKNINHSNTTYTASSTSSIDVQARCLGTGSPTLYMTSFVLKQIA